ncbi:MAG: hypothetical protein ACTHYR_07565 [Brachybacterium sp.]
MIIKPHTPWCEFMAGQCRFQGGLHLALHPFQLLLRIRRIPLVFQPLQDWPHLALFSEEHPSAQQGPPGEVEDLAGAMKVPGPARVYLIEELLKLSTIHCEELPLLSDAPPLSYEVEQVTDSEEEGQLFEFGKHACAFLGILWLAARDWGLAEEPQRTIANSREHIGIRGLPHR